MTDNEQVFAPNNIFLPLIFKRGNEEGKKLFDHLVSTYSTGIIVDQFPSQKKELFKINNPQKNFTEVEFERLYNEWTLNKNIDEEGCWVFYPWLFRLIHILEKEEFIKVRTNRNFYKITPEEQENLSKKTIGIIGLSVGHAVATTMATERVCGTIKLADFDTIDLSNLNRIKTGIQNIGLNKCIVTAREIAQIDPFINLDCYTDGLNGDNIEDFLLSGNKLDLLVDECDGIDMKILCRYEAKKYGIPVVMDTSDRGMLDIERFDLDCERPIFHGLLKEIPDAVLLNIPPAHKTGLTLKIIDIGKASARGRASLLEVGQTINTWPQLASAVTMGGGVVTEVVRSILLDQFNDSGRYYIDLEKILKEKDSIEVQKLNFNESEKPGIDKSSGFKTPQFLYTEVINKIVDAASKAPSLGNNQPWRWIINKESISYYYDSTRNLRYRDPFGHYDHISLGAAYENFKLQMLDEGFLFKPTLLLENGDDILARIPLENTGGKQPENIKVELLHSRCTNRTASSNKPPTDEKLNDLIALESGSIKIQLCSNGAKLNKLNEIIAECEKILLLNEFTHKEYYNRMLSGSKDGRGMSHELMHSSPQEAAVFQIVEDPEVAKHLKLINGGNTIKNSFLKYLGCPVVFLTLEGNNKVDFFNGGIEVQQFWLRAEELGLNLLPNLSPLFLFQYVAMEDQFVFDETEMKQIKNLEIQFHEIFKYDNANGKLFLAWISNKGVESVKEKRLPLGDIIQFNND